MSGTRVIPPGPYENSHTLEDVNSRLLVVRLFFDHTKKPTLKDNPISPQSILGKYFANIKYQNVACMIVDRAMDQLVVSNDLGHPYSLIFTNHGYTNLMKYLVLRAIKERFYHPVGPASVSSLLPYREYLSISEQHASKLTLHSGEEYT